MIETTNHSSKSWVRLVCPVRSSIERASIEASTCLSLQTSWSRSTQRQVVNPSMSSFHKALASLEWCWSVSMSATLEKIQSSVLWQPQIGNSQVTTVTSFSNQNTRRSSRMTLIGAWLKHWSTSMPTVVEILTRLLSTEMVLVSSKCSRAFRRKSHRWRNALPGYTTPWILQRLPSLWSTKESIKGCLLMIDNRMLSILSLVPSSTQTWLRILMTRTTTSSWFLNRPL